MAIGMIGAPQPMGQSRAGIVTSSNPDLHKPKGGVIAGGPGYGGGMAKKPGLPSFGSLFGAPAGGGGATSPQTTVQNGQAMVMSNGKWVAQSSAEGKSALSGGGAAGGGSFGGPSLTNFAQKDPRIEGTANTLENRYAQLKGQEGQMDPFLMESVGNLRNRMSADTTQRAIDRASSGASDYAAGLGERARVAGAQAGRGGDFGSAGIGAAAQRLQAKQAADISLGRERDLDALALGGHNILSAPSGLNLARTGLTNQAAGQMAGFAPTGANLGLAQQGLGLEQWKTGGDMAYKNALLNQQQQQGGLDAYLKILSMSGY